MPISHESSLSPFVETMLAFEGVEFSAPRGPIKADYDELPSDEETKTVEEAELAFKSEEEEPEKPSMEEEFKVVKVWRRPPFPKGLKAGILARGVARIPTKNLLSWFIPIPAQPPNGWLRWLDADLTEIAPEVDVTIEVFRRLISNLTNEEYFKSTRQYLQLRHGTDLKDTPFFWFRLYDMRSVTLPEKLGINLNTIITASRIRGLATEELNNYFLVVYASFPKEIKKWMVAQEKQLLDHFKFKEYTLTDSHVEEIKRIARLVVERESSPQPIRTVRCVGFTDPVGSRSYNAQLGQRRAIVVERALMWEIDNAKPGLSKKIVSWSETLGEDSPVADNHTEEGRARNRRVEVYLSGLGRVSELTERVHRVSLDGVVSRGLRLLQDQGRFREQLTELQTKRISCVLRKVLSSDVDDRFVYAKLWNVWNTGRPVPEFEYLKDLITVKSHFGPSVDDVTFVKRLQELDQNIVEAMERVAQLMTQHGEGTNRGILQLRAWVLERAKDDASIYNCYRDMLNG